jgi:AAA15 family ATPase/GTPase
MLKEIKLNNYGPLNNLEWLNIGRLNLIIGENDTGKTFLLKALYSAIRTLEEYQKGDDKRDAKEILCEKLYWTFQPDKIGDLVTKGANGNALFEAKFDDQRVMHFQWGKDATKKLTAFDNTSSGRKSNSIFLPAKEVLSLHKVILKSREDDKSFGFDDTYLDLARALRRIPVKGRNYQAFAQTRAKLEGLFGGRIEYDESQERWQFRKGNQKFSIGVTAEGIKKIAILDTLLGNRYLDAHSMIFIDEPESALHPSAIIKFLDCIELLAETGIQIFIASHSFFVIKKLYLIAQTVKFPVSVLNAVPNGLWEQHDLKYGMPDNPIIDESIRLYKEEVEMKFQ